MLNFRFKNPYRSDESALSDQELNRLNNQAFLFKGKKQNLKIYEFDNTRLLAPKGKSLFYINMIYNLINRIINIFSKNMVERFRIKRNGKIFY